MAVFLAGTLPASAMMTFKMSPHYQAGELFLYAPIRGTAALFHGVRKAMILFLTIPGVLVSGTMLWFGLPDRHILLLAVPALMATICRSRWRHPAAARGRSTSAS